MPTITMEPVLSDPSVTIPLLVEIHAPWLGSLIALVSGVVGVIITSYTLHKVEDKKVTEARRSNRNSKSLDAAVEVIEILDQRLRAVVAGGWNIEKETEMWSAITRLTILGPGNIAKAALEVGEALIGLEDCRSKKLALIQYQLTAQAKKSEFLRLVREHSEPVGPTPRSQCRLRREGKRTR